MKDKTSNKYSDTRDNSSIYIDSDNIISVDLSNIKGYTISNLADAISLISQLYNSGDFESACLLSNYAFNSAKRENQSSEEFRRNLTVLYGLAGDVYAENGDFIQSQQFYKSFQCLKMQLKTNLFKDTQFSETIKLYQFRRFSNYTLTNLLNHEITLSSPKTMNDVFDSLIYQWLGSPIYGVSARHKKHLKPYKQSFDDYRIACFCEDCKEKSQYAIQNNLMWSHYADEHQGFCIEYVFHRDDFRRDKLDEMTASRLFKMNYWDPDTDDPIDFSRLQSDNTLNPATAFLTKHKNWSYENEVRLLQYKPQEGALRVQYKLCDKSKISAIYFGYRCPNENIQIIKKLLLGTRTRFYKMEIDYSNIFKFKLVEI